MLAAALSVRLGYCPAADAERIRAPSRGGRPAHEPRRDRGPRPARRDAIVAAMARDKKVEDGRLRFVLLRGIGQAFAGAEVEPAELLALLRAPEP